MRPSATDVHGTVVDGMGQPVGGVTIIVTGKTPLKTGPDGTFHFADVDIPYDLSVAEKGPFGDWIKTYQGLTRRALRIPHSPEDPVSTATATITGSVPVAPDEITRVFFGGPSVPVYSAAAIPFTGSYGIEVTWAVPPRTVSGKLFVLRHKESNEVVTRFDGFASKELRLTDGEVLSNQNFHERDLVDPPERRISGIVRPPTGYTSTTRWLNWIFSGVSLELVDDRSGTELFDYVVPDFEGATFQLYELAIGPGGRSALAARHGILAGTHGVTLGLLPGPELVSPLDGSTNVDSSTLFEWRDGGSAGFYDLLIYPAPPPPDTLQLLMPAGPTFEFYLDGTSTRIPDWGELGWGLPGNAPYRWSVGTYSHPSSLDEILAPEPSEFRGLEFSSSLSPRLSFTTRPDLILPKTIRRAADDP